MYLKSGPFLEALFALHLMHLVSFSFCQRNNENSLNGFKIDMEDLMERELQFIESLNNDVGKLQNKVDAIKNLMQEFKEEHQKSLNNPEKYISNPLNGFALIRRMHYDWPKIEFFMSETEDLTSNQSTTEKSLSTSMSDIVKLRETELLLIDSVDTYAATLQNKVNVLRDLVHELKEHFSSPSVSGELLQRLRNNWSKIKMVMNQPVGEDNLAAIRKYRAEMPTAIDMQEASEAIYRLQTTYDLKAADLVQGIVNGKQYDVKWKSIDSYFMGYYLLNKTQYYPAGIWLYSSIRGYEKNNNFNAIVGFSEDRPLELYAETLVAQNRPRDALIYIAMASDLKPIDAHLLKLKNDVQQLANTNNDPPLKYNISTIDNYERGCRGYFSNQTSKMFCILNTTTTPFLRLAPFKMEVLHMEPYMVLFHDIISEQEMQHLKNLAKPNLKRALVYNKELSRSVAASARTSKFSWFVDELDATVKRINKRIIDMTGFDIKGSESLQVVNYGLGGHYGRHYDFFNVSLDTPVVATQGNRIATVMFYMSDVEQGGATVFPYLKTAIFPRKGSAVVWYNLDNKVEGDNLTLHAACPVIVGSKWVCNKWIRSKAQIFRKPCYK